VAALATFQVTALSNARMQDMTYIPKKHGRTDEWNEGGGYPRKGDDWDGYGKHAHKDDFYKKDNDYRHGDDKREGYDKRGHKDDSYKKDDDYRHGDDKREGHDKHAHKDDFYKKDDDYRHGDDKREGHDKHAHKDDFYTKDDDYRHGDDKSTGHDKREHKDDFCRKDDDCGDGQKPDWKDKYADKDDCKPEHSGGSPQPAYNAADQDAEMADLHGALASMSDVGSVVDFAIDHLDSAGGPLDTSFDVADAHTHDAFVS
jgi:hypothetical protein